MSFVMVAKEEATLHRAVDSSDAEPNALDYFGGSSGREPGPEAFLLDQWQGLPGAHFYPVDQFQLMLGASGPGHDRHDVAPRLLHYVDAFTSHLLLPGDSPPLWLYTLRAEAAPPVSLFPTDTNDTSLLGGRNIVVDVVEVRSIHIYGIRGVHTSTLIPEEEDGLRAERVVADSGAEIGLPSTFGTSGQFVFVSRGSILHEKREFEFASLGWMSPGESGREISAGRDGAECLVLRFPYPPNRSVRLAS